MRLPDTDTLPFAVFVAAPDGCIRTTNATFERLLPGRTGQHWPSLFDRIEARPDGAVDTSRAVATVNGTARYFDLVCRPLVADENDSDQVLGILLDVTEQTRREAENRAILETVVDAIILMDEDGIVEVFNPSATALFGFAPEQIIGRPVATLMPEPMRSRHDGFVRHYLLTGERRIIGIGRELEARHRDGHLIPIHLAVSEIRLDGRRRFAGIVRDLSEQRASRAALAEQREKLAHVGRLSIMGEMTASIAHEINQPLTAIAMYAQASLKLLARGDVDRDKLASALDKLNTQTLRAGAIIERIQRFARAEQTQRLTVDVNGLLTELSKLAEGDARIHDVEIHLDLEERLPAARVDPIQIQQVALNLIRNAIDAMQEVACRHGNCVTIRSRRRGPGVAVEVSDQGTGVADEQANLLFKPFHTTKKHGMGMGLSICRTIIDEHGGELRHRNNPQHGATFYFVLPAVEPQNE